MSKTILIVDDDPVIRNLLTDYLSNHGYTVRSLSQGSECIASLRAAKPDILILDMIMPDMTGLQVLDSLVEEEDLSDLPVIMLSANVESDIRKSGATRANHYIQKPFELKVILEAVQKMTRTGDDS